MPNNAHAGRLGGEQPFGSEGRSGGERPRPGAGRRRRACPRQDAPPQDGRRRHAGDAQEGEGFPYGIAAHDTFSRNAAPYTAVRAAKRQSSAASTRWRRRPSAVAAGSK